MKVFSFLIGMLTIVAHRLPPTTIRTLGRFMYGPRPTPPPAMAPPINRIPTTSPIAVPRSICHSCR